MKKALTRAQKHGIISTVKQKYFTHQSGCDIMIERKIKFGNLFDFYGQLLTEKQQKILQLYYLEDLSLGEIGDILSVSRQAIHDVIKRSEKTLDSYELKLELFKKFNEQNSNLEEVIKIIDKETQINESDVLMKIKNIVIEVLN